MDQPIHMNETDRSDRTFGGLGWTEPGTSAHFTLTQLFNLKLIILKVHTIHIAINFSISAL